MPVAPFALDVGCDISAEVPSSSQAFDPKHPLWKDRERLDTITDAMFARIQKVLFPGSPRQPRRAWTRRSNHAGRIERVLVGTGVGADDVLSDAVIGLLLYPPDRLKGTWEGLAVTIAENKAHDALRDSQKGLYGTAHRPRLRLVPGDREVEGPDGEMEPPLFESVPSNSADPEAEYFVIQGALKVRDLAREYLSDRDREIFFAIHFGDDSRREVGERIGLTGQRVGQIYDAALRTLEARPDYPFKPPKAIGRIPTRRNE